MILLKAYEMVGKEIPDKVERVNRDKIYERLVVLLTRRELTWLAAALRRNPRNS